jgi:hypothetical protein
MLNQCTKLLRNIIRKVKSRPPLPLRFSKKKNLIWKIRNAINPNFYGCKLIADSLPLPQAGSKSTELQAFFKK